LGEAWKHTKGVLSDIRGADGRKALPNSVFKGLHAVL